MVENIEDSQIVERKLATILSADVAEYSRLMAESEEETVKIFRGHKALFELIINIFIAAEFLIRPAMPFSPNQQCCGSRAQRD